MFTRNHVVKWLMQHRNRVSLKLSILGNDLAMRGRRHDNSYTDKTETALFVNYLSENDPDKKQKTKELLDGIHQSRNDYCPQFFEHGISDMNMLQLMEYICDRMAFVEESQIAAEKSIPDIPFEEYKEVVFSGLDITSVELRTLIENTMNYILHRNEYIKATIERAEKNYGTVEEE